MNDQCGRTLPFTPPLRGGSFPLPSGRGRLKTSVFTRPPNRDSSTSLSLLCSRRKLDRQKRLQMRQEDFARLFHYC